MGDTIRINGVRFVDSTDDLIVQEERQVVRLPIDRERMVIGISIRDAVFNYTLRLRSCGWTGLRRGEDTGNGPGGSLRILPCQ